MMDTVILNEDNIEEAATLIKAGELVAFPTETVYGLGADATQATAVKQVYAAKGRPSDNPLIVHLSDVTELSQFVDPIPEAAMKLAEAFWPGPLTMIFEVKPGSLPAEVTGGLSTAAFRVPDHPLTLALIQKAGVPLVGPSANTSGKPSPTSAQHVSHDLSGKIAAVLDGGQTSVGIESTVLDLSVPEPVILRPGKIIGSDIAPFVSRFSTKNDLPADSQPKAPGMKYQHYSPDAKVLMMPADEKDWTAAVKKLVDQDKSVGVLASAEIIQGCGVDSQVSFELSQEDDISEASRQLFAGLRFLDEVVPKIDLILVQTYEDEGLGNAYMNRLQKSADNCYFIEQ